MHRSKQHPFNHLIGEGEERQRHREAERLRGLEIDDQIDSWWLAAGVSRAGFLPSRMRRARLPLSSVTAAPKALVTFMQRIFMTSELTGRRVAGLFLRPHRQRWKLV
jgi:hypothetical protein